MILFSLQYGNQVHENYKVASHREDKLRSIENHGSLGSSSLYIKSRVAMDFTGPGGRVVANPNEALGVAIEEGHHWRVSTMITFCRQQYVLAVLSLV